MRVLNRLASKIATYKENEKKTKDNSPLTKIIIIGDHAPHTIKKKWLGLILFVQVLFLLALATMYHRFNKKVMERNDGKFIRSFIAGVVQKYDQYLYSSTAEVVQRYEISTTDVVNLQQYDHQLEKSTTEEEKQNDQHLDKSMAGEVSVTISTVNNLTSNQLKSPTSLQRTKEGKPSTNLFKSEFCLSSKLYNEPACFVEPAVFNSTEPVTMCLYNAEFTGDVMNSEWLSHIKVRNITSLIICDYSEDIDYAEDNKWLPQIRFISINDLILRGNITDINDGAFDHPLLENLLSLTLIMKYLKILRNDTFRGLSQLQSLSLPDCEGLVNVESGVMEPVKGSLSILQINYMIHGNVRDVIKNFTGVENMTRLENIDLRYNNITEIKSNTFKGLINAKSLYLSATGLYYIHSNAFSCCTNLEQIFLDGNYLETIDINTFPGIFSHRLYLTLVNNPWRCDCSLEWVQSWSSQIKYSPKCRFPEENESKTFSEANFCPRNANTSTPWITTEEQSYSNDRASTEETQSTTTVLNTHPTSLANTTDIITSDDTTNSRESSSASHEETTEQSSPKEISNSDYPEASTESNSNTKIVTDISVPFNDTSSHSDKTFTDENYSSAIVPEETSVEDLKDTTIIIYNETSTDPNSWSPNTVTKATSDSTTTEDFSFSSMSQSTITPSSQNDVTITDTTDMNPLTVTYITTSENGDEIDSSTYYAISEEPTSSITNSIDESSTETKYQSSSTVNNSYDTSTKPFPASHDSITPGGTKTEITSQTDPSTSDTADSEITSDIATILLTTNSIYQSSTNPNNMFSTEDHTRTQSPTTVIKNDTSIATTKSSITPAGVINGTAVWCTLYDSGSDSGLIIHIPPSQEPAIDSDNLVAFPSRKNNFFIIDECEVKNNQVELILQVPKGSSLIWTASECNYGEPQCVTDLKDVVRLQFLKPDTSYTLCLLFQPGFTFSPFNCLAYKTKPIYEARTWIKNGDRAIFVACCIVGLILTLLAGAALLYLLIKRYPKLIKGKRVLVVKHRVADVMILPKNYQGQLLSAESLQDYGVDERTSYDRTCSHTSSVGRSSTTSYITVNEPTPVELFAYRFEQIMDRLKGVSRMVPETDSLQEGQPTTPRREFTPKVKIELISNFQDYSRSNV